eukprot:scaffold29327_cov101-Isochrysis_galbana.AAC.2
MHDMRHTPRDGPGLAAGLSPAGSPRFAFEVGQGTQGCLVYFCGWASAREDTIRALRGSSPFVLFISLLSLPSQDASDGFSVRSRCISPGSCPEGDSVHGGRRTEAAAPAASGSL